MIPVALQVLWRFAAGSRRWRMPVLLREAYHVSWALEPLCARSFVVGPATVCAHPPVRCRVRCVRDRERAPQCGATQDKAVVRCSCTGSARVLQCSGVHRCSLCDLRSLSPQRAGTRRLLFEAKVLALRNAENNKIHEKIPYEQNNNNNPKQQQ